MDSSCSQKNLIYTNALRGSTVVIWNNDQIVYRAKRNIQNKIAENIVEE